MGASFLMPARTGSLHRPCFPHHHHRTARPLCLLASSLSPRRRLLRPSVPRALLFLYCLR
eukprot:3715311-Prymnesium_polylepis.1